MGQIGQFVPNLFLIGVVMIPSGSFLCWYIFYHCYLEIKDSDLGYNSTCQILSSGQAVEEKMFDDMLLIVSHHRSLYLLFSFYQKIFPSVLQELQNGFVKDMIAQYSFITVCSYHVTYVFQSDFTLYSFLNVKDFIARNRCDI